MGYAPGYAAAEHSTSEWNHLGTNGKVDDGVLWSTDGGSTWGNDTVYVGDNIAFQVTLWSAGYGSHNYDQAKAWVDWNSDQIWENDNVPNAPGDAPYQAGETILAGQYFKDIEAITGEHGSDQEKQLNLNYSTLTTFLTDEYAITGDMIGDLWLSARAQCNHVKYNNMTPYGFLNQGEVENWKIEVAPVPEPTTMLLFGTGLVGLVGIARRKKK